MKICLKLDLRNYDSGILQWWLSNQSRFAFTDKTMEQIQAELDRRDGQGSDAA